MINKNIKGMIQEYLIKVKNSLITNDNSIDSKNK